MKQFSLIPVALLAVVAFAAALLVVAPVSDAIGEDLSSTYGEPTEIDIAPGFQWRYTPEFPSDLEEYVTVTLQVNDSNIGTVSNGLVTVTIPSGAAVGTVYNVVIKASMTQPVAQTAYQYVQFTVVGGLSVSGSVGDIVLGSKIDFTPTGTSSMGTVTWAVKSGTTLPAGLALSSGKVTGTPTATGEQTISLTATAAGQSKDLIVKFTVFPKIVSGSNQTISSYNTAVSSTGVTNPDEIGVTWKVSSGTLPSGFSLDSSTGVVSGKSATVQSVTVTLKGTSTEGPSQSVTHTVTIRSEPALTLSGGSSILTYKGNAAAVTSTVTANATSTITWTENSDLATISNGVVTVKNPSTAGMSQTIKVTAKTLYGQTATKNITLSVEDTLTVSGSTSASLIAGEDKVLSFTVSGGSGNTMKVKSATTGIETSVSGTKVTLSSASPLTDGSVVLTFTSAAGQTVSKTVSVDVYNVLAFTSSPTGGAIIYAV